MKKRAMNGTVAILFLILICAISLFVVIGLVIPFIQNQTNLSEKEANLRIDLTNERTSYDPNDGFAIIEVKRGLDNASLHGIEIIITLNNSDYKTTLRAPGENSSKSYLFDLNDLKARGLVPSKVSVAPVFFVDARELLGQISSEAKIPNRKVVQNIEDLIAKVKENGERVYTITHEVYEKDYLKCSVEIGEDPWGGCPEYVGRVYSINNVDGKNFFDFPEIDINLEGKYVRFRSFNENGSECLTNENSCDKITEFVNSGSWSEMQTYAVVESSEGLIETTGISACSRYDYFYIYDNKNCA